MYNKRLKYQEFLSKFSNCPSSDYSEMEDTAYRWVHLNAEHPNDFLPLHLISNPPPRMLEEEDKMCIGYGLSLFSTQKTAYENYKKQYLVRKKHLRVNFVTEKGTQIAELNIFKHNGISNKPNENGHFTFHEYVETTLENQILTFFDIFDNNGNFID